MLAFLPMSSVRDYFFWFFHLTPEAVESV